MQNNTTYNYYNRCVDFHNVYAYSEPGQTDTAEFYGSIGNDTFDANPSQALMTGADFLIQAMSFFSVEAYSEHEFIESTGYDTATITGPTGTEEPSCNAGQCVLSDVNYFILTFSFAELNGVVQ